MFAAQEAYAFSPYAIPPAVTAVLAFAFGLHVLLRRIGRVSIAFFVMASTAAAWQAAFAMMYLSSEPIGALLWARLAYVAVPFIPAAAYQFTVEMLRIAPQRRIALWLGWAAAAQFAVLAFATDYLVPGVREFWWGFYPRYNTVASVPYLAFFFGYLIAAMIEFIRAYPKSHGVERSRIRLLAIAFAVACIGCFDYLAVYGIPVYPLGFAGLLGYIGVAAYTIRRYDLVPISPLLAAREIISTMNDVLLVTDRDGRIEVVNDAACLLLEYDEEELRGRQLDELIYPSDDKETTLRGRSFRDMEYAFRTKSGGRIELTLSVSPVVSDGTQAGAVMIGRDLRERKQSERETRRAVTLLQSTFDSTADGILVIGPDRKILTCNQRFEEMWRLPKEMRGGDDRDLIAHLADQLTTPEEFLRNLEELHDHPEAESFHLLTFKDGRRFEQYSIGRYLDKSPVRVWSFRDMTARLVAEDALRQSEERYRFLFEQNAAGVIVTSYGGLIVDCNSTLATMLQYSEEELNGRNVTDLYTRPALGSELVEQLKHTPTLRGIEVELRRKDGASVWVLANLSAVRSGDQTMFHATVVDISDRKRAEEQIEYHAYHDVLTHLPNRRLFEERLELTVLSAKRHGHTVAVVFIDLDDFKNVNDTAGHSAADELLVHVGERLRSVVRQTDTVARLGGDEFTIILPDLSQPEDAAQVAHKILEAIVKPISIGSTTLDVTASIGVAIHPHDGHDVETLLRHADDAMYRAKNAGGNNYQLCTPEMKQRAIERLTLQSRLRNALNKDQLMLLFQPQVKLKTGTIVGAEALVRWNDPDRGLIEPRTFIPLAEETRLIIPLGEWVLNAACRQLRKWQDEDLPPLRIAVNLSARQFQQGDLLDMVRRAIDDAGISPDALELEITETTAMQNAEVTIEILRVLREIGVSIAIDDFGSGYSSLGYLQRLPINAVKVDRTFIRGLPAAEGNAAIVGAVISIAGNMKLRVIAEGVETKEELAFLRRRRCDEAQGYYFSTPVPADDFFRLVERAPRKWPVNDIRSANVN